MKPLETKLGNPEFNEVEFEDVVSFKVFLNLNKLNNMTDVQKRNFISNSDILGIAKKTSFKIWSDSFNKNIWGQIFARITYPSVLVLVYWYEYTYNKFINQNSEFFV